MADEAALLPVVVIQHPNCGDSSAVVAVVDCDWQNIADHPALDVLCLTVTEKSMTVPHRYVGRVVLTAVWPQSYRIRRWGNNGPSGLRPVPSSLCRRFPPACLGGQYDPSANQRG